MDTDRAAFSPNKETHLKPILASTIVDQLMGEGITAIEDEKDVFNIQAKNHKTFLDRIANDIGCKTDEIVDFELAMYDFHPPALTGFHNEFVSSPRLDNLASSLASLDALTDYHKTGDKDNNEVSMCMLFDHEEVGSTSAQGADSNMVVEATERISTCLKPTMTKEDYYRQIRNSFFVSADLAHAVHPNYPEKHQSSHQPQMQKGIVLKLNANQRYSTDSVSAAILRVLAANA